MELFVKKFEYIREADHAKSCETDTVEKLEGVCSFEAFGQKYTLLGSDTEQKARKKDVFSAQVIRKWRNYEHRRNDAYESHGT